MKKLFVAAGLASVLALASCASLDKAIGDNQAELANICRNAPVIHLAFVTIAANGNISASIVEREAQAYNVVAEVCANPPQNTAEALTIAARAYASILNARGDLAARTGE